MIRLALALLLWLWAPAAGAAEVAAQAGEHPGFTRLSLHLGGAGWRLGRIAGGYGLRIDTGAGFATGRVFETIGRQRIAALQPGPGALGLALGCDCHARTFRHGEGWLVIDILDGPPGPGAAHESPLDPPPPPPLPDRGPLPLLMPRPPVAAWFLPGAPPAPPSPPAPPAAPTQAPAPDMAGAMVAGLIRAADLGLLDLAQPPGHLAAAPQPAAPPAGGARPGVSAQTAMDAALAIAGASRAADCPGDGLFDLALWAGSGDFAAETAPLRAALAGERGAIAPAAAEALARSYLAFGFGREAVEVLALAPRDSPEREILHLLARLVDDRPADAQALAGQGHCAGPVLLWRALARGTIEDLDETGRTAAVTAFRLLPDALRGQIAPRLALLFAGAGDALAADEILRRGGGDADPERAAQAGIALARAAGDAGATARRLTEAAHRDPHAGPQALVDMVDLALAQGRDPAPGDLELLAAARFEYRGRPEESALAAAQARLLSHTGAHRAALDLALSLPAGWREPALAAALASLLGEADDATFLALAFDGLPAPPDPALANALAGRLLALGFPERALALLRGVSAGAVQEERRYLRAEAAAALGRADLVEAALLGLAGPRAAAIRAAIAPAPGPLSGPAPAATPDGPEPGPLARGAALLEEAGETRDRTRRLLETIATAPPS